MNAEMDLSELELQGNSLADVESVKIPPAYEYLVPNESLFRTSEINETFQYEGSAFQMFDRWLSLKILLFAHHCYHHSRADWCIRITDDVYMNRKGLPKFYKWLKTLGNPRTDSRAFGNCLTYYVHPNLTNVFTGWYLQGGSGYGFSRHATEEFLRFGEEWVLNTYQGDDIYLSYAIIRMGLNGTHLACPFFAGHFIKPQMWDQWKDRWVRVLGRRPCPEFISKASECGPMFGQYRYVVFHHSLGDFMTQENWDRWMSNVPEDAMFWFWRKQINICKNRTDGRTQVQI
jgi:hypothetical protein